MKRDFTVNIENIMQTAYLQYSLSVNVGRAIPDVRDGLKPCNRRVLFAMRQMGLTKSHATVKCAKVVGEVLGNYHPHGDSSVYDTLVRMAQDFSMRNTLIEGQGNFGNVDGDAAAAYRYTECRMERLTDELLADIEKETVPMIPTFDEQTLEPEVLPAKFPNLLVNGSMGIGVGMATSIPPHNLGEVIDAAVYLLDHPTATVAELMTCLPGPDFPTGGVICGVNEIRSLYETGHGVLKVRGKAEIIEDDNKSQIIIHEIPFALNKGMLVRRIAEVVNDKIITGISNLQDVSSDKSIKIVIDVKRGAMASVVLNQLYTHTQLESVLGCNMLVVDHNRPRVMNLPQILQAYLDHRMEVVTRRTKFELRKAEARAHILEGYLLALKNLDEVVRIIRESRTREDAARALMERFGFTKIQVNAILDMRLHQLTGLASEDLENEYNELMKQIAYYKELLASREKRMGVIREELLYVKERYADGRRTEIIQAEGDLNYADLIPRHACVITVSDTGYIKRVPADTYRTQHRGGMGIIGMETKEEDHVAHLFNADSHDLIFFITDRGLMYWLNVYDIPEGSRIAKGKAIVNLIKVEPGEQICAMLTLNRGMFDQPGLSIVMATRRGIVKKTALSEFRNLRRVGLRALIIEEGDDLIGAGIADGNCEIILSSCKGMACRFAETDIRTMGRASRGVTGIRFKLDDDYVVGMEIVPSAVPLGEETDFEPEAEAGDISDDSQAEESAASGDEEVPETDEADEAVPEDLSKPQLLVVTSGGMGKRSYVENYRLTRRGAKGVKNMNLAPGESVVAAIRVSPGDEILITTQRGQVVRTRIDEVRLVGRNSKGVRIMNLRKNDRITSVSRLIEVKVDDAETAGENETVVAPAATAEPVDPAVTDAGETGEVSAGPAAETAGTETDGGGEEPVGE